MQESVFHVNHEANVSNFLPVGLVAYGWKPDEMWVQAVDHLEHVDRGLESAQVLNMRGGAARFANVEDLERAFHGHIVDGLKPLSFPQGTYDENLEHAEETGGHGDTDLQRRDFHDSIWGGEDWYVGDEL